jgi:hypothetical protein
MVVVGGPRRGFDFQGCREKGVAGADESTERGVLVAALFPQEESFIIR